MLWWWWTCPKRRLRVCVWEGEVVALPTHTQDEKDAGIACAHWRAPLPRHAAQRRLCLSLRLWSVTTTIAATTSSLIHSQTASPRGGLCGLSLRSQCCTLCVSATASSASESCFFSGTVHCESRRELDSSSSACTSKSNPYHHHHHHRHTLTFPNNCFS